MIVLSHALHDDGTTKIGLFCEFLNVLMWKNSRNIYSNTYNVVSTIFMFFDYVTKSKSSLCILNYGLYNGKNFTYVFQTELTQSTISN